MPTPRAPYFCAAIDDDPAVARSEIVNDIVGSHPRQAQHAVDDRLARRREEDVRRARRPLAAPPRPAARIASASTAIESVARTPATLSRSPGSRRARWNRMNDTIASRT